MRLPALCPSCAVWRTRHLVIRNGMLACGPFDGRSCDEAAIRLAILKGRCSR